MRRRDVMLALTVALVGCTDVRVEDCAISCTAASGCPDGFSCNQGTCRIHGAVGDCGDLRPDGGSLDGGTLDGAPRDGDGRTECDDELASLGTSFELGAAGWTHGVLDNAATPNWPQDEWQYGTAAVGPFGGPSGCHDGTGCWGTELNDNYTSCQRAALVSPAFDLSSCAGRNVKVSFWSWHDFWTGSYEAQTWLDGGLVEFSTDGTTWSSVTPTPAYPGTININPVMASYACVLRDQFHVDGKPGFVGSGQGWTHITIPIPAAMLTASFRLRFAYGSGVSYPSSDPEVDRDHTRPGWYIDELGFSAQ